MRRLVLFLAGGVLLIAGPVEAGPNKATLVIHAVAPGDADGIEFRTLGDIPGSFIVADGAERIFRNLAPGSYVVVQAPPHEGWDLRVQCSDGAPLHRHDLVGGDELICTFTSERV